ncbi:conserved hypothetical protein [Ricinus communis]|uniref:Uncharacterized protein n=1 Tax=Ricinus communis TaxID=3988 RepID=B9SNW8_RICCO|nr:conserved hypothetical protein [Ricinus communis]
MEVIVQQAVWWITLQMIRTKLSGKETRTRKKVVGEMMTDEIKTEVNFWLEGLWHIKLTTSYCR